MKMLKKNDCLNELLKGKTAAKSSYFEFIFTALMIILTVIRNLRLIKQSFSRDNAELSGIYENKHSFTSQKELKKRNDWLMMKSHCCLTKS